MIKKASTNSTRFFLAATRWKSVGPDIITEDTRQGLNSPRPETSYNETKEEEGSNRPHERGPPNLIAIILGLPFGSISVYITRRLFEGQTCSQFLYLLPSKENNSILWSSSTAQGATGDIIEAAPSDCWNFRSGPKRKGPICSIKEPLNRGQDSNIRIPTKYSSNINRSTMATAPGPKVRGPQK